MAKAASESDKVFFTRGFILQSMLESSNVFPSQRKELLYFKLLGSSDRPLRWSSSVYFTDGAGGQWGDWPMSRRVALSVVGLSWSFDPVARMFPS